MNSIEPLPTTRTAGGLPAWTDPRRWLIGTAYGVLLWAAPFLVSVPFFSRSGELQTDLFVFKSAMAVVGSLTGVILLVRYLGRLFRRRLEARGDDRRPDGDPAPGPFWRVGLFTGLLWLLINWGLDFLILLPLNGQSPQEYMVRIGFGYLAIPIAATGIAYAMERART
ncbi:MAG: hypothetical protein RIF32_21000 [Leptospirales bacterium]|jgi:hypothetical protein